MCENPPPGRRWHRNDQQNSAVGLPMWNGRKKRATSGGGTVRNGRVCGEKKSRRQNVPKWWRCQEAMGTEEKEGTNLSLLVCWYPYMPYHCRFFSLFSRATTYSCDITSVRVPVTAALSPRYQVRVMSRHGVLRAPSAPVAMAPFTEDMPFLPPPPSCAFDMCLCLFARSAGAAFVSATSCVVLPPTITHYHAEVRLPAACFRTARHVRVTHLPKKEALFAEVMQRNQKRSRHESYESSNFFHCSRVPWSHVLRSPSHLSHACAKK